MPACHETVTWLILNKPIYITKQQVRNGVTFNTPITPQRRRKSVHYFRLSYPVILTALANGNMSSHCFCKLSIKIITQEGSKLQNIFY
jgi:hypothetical protein